jgi:arginyl-tRNA synthetase
VTLEDLVDEVGVDAARYTLIRYPADSPLTMDLDLLVQRDEREPRVLRAVRPRPHLFRPAQRR